MKSKKKKITLGNASQVSCCSPIGFETVDGTRGFLMADSYVNPKQFIPICSRKFHRRNTFGHRASTLDGLIRVMLKAKNEMYIFENEWVLLRWLAHSRNKIL